MFVYFADKNGWVWSTSRERGTWPTGIKAPRLAGQRDIDPKLLLDECDVVYKPLSSGLRRRDLPGALS